MSGYIMSFLYGADVYYGGHYQIRGNVTKNGVACARRVLLYLRSTGRLLRSTWSASDGSYVFKNIAYRYQDYFVVVQDLVDPMLNAVIADLVTPEPMS